MRHKKRKKKKQRPYKINHGVFRKLLTLILLACWLPTVVYWTGGSAGCGGAGGGGSASVNASQEKVVYYLDDHLGNANLLVDSNGNVLREEERYPYGLDRRVDNPGGVQSDYAYTGKEVDEETGLVYFGGRYYVPELGRWASPDPKYLNAPSAIVEYPHAANLYSYALNNPSNFIDPDGFEPWPKNDFPNASIVPQNAAERAFANRITNGVSEVSTMFIPGVNDVRDAYEFKTGRDLITNESIGWGGRVASGVGLIVGSGAVYRRVIPDILRTSYDDIHAVWRGNEGARAIFRANGSGVVVTDLFKGNAGRGEGGLMLADALKQAGFDKPTSITFKNIIEERTLNAIRANISAEKTVLGRTMNNTAQELGGTITSMGVSCDKLGKYDISAKIAY